LWCARFFKTRSLAAEEVKSGHVRLNGQRTKAAHEVKPGDTLTISKGSEDYEVVVSRLPQRRGPAAEALGCYVETEVSVERRRVHAAQRASEPKLLAPTGGRPDKRTRRLIRARRDSFNPG
jgi:ribosome-associated heat shock protein Hsp15